MTILTKQQLMDTLDIRADILRSLTARGMPHLKVSARVSVYVLEEVVEWLKANPAGEEVEESLVAPRCAARPQSRPRPNPVIV